MQCWGAALAVLACGGLQCRFRPFSSPARFAVLGIGFVPTFSGSTSLDSPFSNTVPASGCTVLPMVAGSRSAVCVSPIHLRVGPDSTARSTQSGQYWGRRFRPPLPRRAYRWSPRRMKPRSWRVFNAVRTVPFREFGDVDDGHDLRIGCGAVVVRAVRSRRARPSRWRCPHGI